MRKARFILFFFFLSSAVFYAQAPEKVDLQMMTKIKAEGLSNSKVMDILFELTDVIGPRLTASTGMRNSEQWTRKQLEDWGLSNAKTEAWGKFGKGWDIQKCYVAMTSPYYQSLIAVPKAWSPGTNGLIKGKVVHVQADSLKDLEKYKGKLKGKIVVLAGNIIYTLGTKPDAKRHSEEDLDRICKHPDFADDGKEGDYTPSQISQYRAMRAMRRQMAAMLAAEEPLAVVSSTRGNMGTIFTTNGAPYAFDAKPVPPELEMSTEHVNRIVRLLKAKKEVELEMELKTNFYVADSLEYNVIAEIPGTDKMLASEVVMLGAHLDSWHAATGATDNAAGCAVAMEAVRILKALDVKPRRTIRIALWSGEEQGLHGSKNYVKNHFGDRETMQLKPEHSKFSAYFNLDNGAGKIRGIYAQSNDAAKPIFEEWIKPFHDLGAKTVTLRNTGSTDHIPFDALGLPGFQFIQDGLEYFSRTHHTNMDTYDRVPEDDLKQASVIMAAFVYNAAMRDEKLPRKSLPKPRKLDTAVR